MADAIEGTGEPLSRDGRQCPPGLWTDIDFRQILEMLPAAVYATDAAGRIVFYNEAAAELWGCRPALGRSEFCGSWKLYWPDGTPLPHDQCPMALALKQQRPIQGMEAVAERPDGTRVPFQPYPVPIFDQDGALIGGVNLLVETADRRQAEEIRQRLALIVRSSDDAIISKDLNGIIASWNQGAERLFGYTADEVIGKSVTILIPEERHDEEPEILGRIRRGERVDHYETVRRRKDGGLIDISLTVSPLLGIDGKVIGASKIARDITERKQAERNRQLVIDEMKHRVKNTLATVHAIAAQTFRSAPSSEHKTFSARLHALATAHDALTHENWDRALLRDLTKRALEPFRERGQERLAVEGPDVWLDAHKSFLLTLALHELATNAVKYGALSNESGRVNLGWQVMEAGTRLRLTWQESGGPTVTPPEHKGFGSLLIERAVERELGGLRLDFAPTGVRCTLDIAL